MFDARTLCNLIANERAFFALNKERSVPVRSSAPNAERLALILLRDDQRRERGNVGHGPRRERAPRRQMLLIAQRTRMLGRKEPSRSEAVMHLFEVRCARQYVVVRVIRVERPSPYRTPGSTQVGGMICISPIAPRPRSRARRLHSQFA